MLLCDAADGRPRAANSAALALLGLDRDAFLHLAPGELAGLLADGDRRYRRPDGATVDLQVTIEPWHGDRAACLVVLRPGSPPAPRPAVVDLTDGAHDPHTGLPGRLAHVEALTAALARVEATGDTRSLAVVYVDLDVDAGGDQALPVLAERLRAAVRRTDLVAHLGPRSFAVLCEHLHGEIDAAGLVADIVDDLTAPVALPAGDLVPRFTVGLAMAGDPGLRSADLVADPDGAIAAAREQGRARHAAFTAAARTRSRRQEVAARAIADALHRDELAVHFQPVLGLADGSVRAVEALARWHPPSRPAVSPDQFIPVAERSGLIVPLGDRVLRAACAYGATRPELSVAVNVSPHQVNDDLIRRVVGILDETGLPAPHLRLELTETAVLEEPETAIVVLRQLTDLGVRLSLDDFGTGYSSILVLRRLPFDRLKIDRSLIRAVTETRADRDVIAAVLSLASAVGVATTAEGVETEEQVDVLRELGCDEAQGFLFGRPMPAEDCDAWLGAYR
jgi:diguanylate cyclase (GGDEF)-like protein